MEEEAGQGDVRHLGLSLPVGTPGGGGGVQGKKQGNRWLHRHSCPVCVCVCVSCREMEMLKFTFTNYSIAKCNEASQVTNCCGWDLKWLQDHI